MTPKFKYTCTECGQQVQKKPCSKESHALGTWRCPCGNRKVNRTKVKADNE